MIRKLINIFLIVVMCIQLAPVLQVGCLLSSNQFQEELPHTCCDGAFKANWNPSEPRHSFLFYGDGILGNYLDSGNHRYGEFSERLPDNFSSEIQTPPPNRPAC